MQSLLKVARARHLLKRRNKCRMKTLSKSLVRFFISVQNHISVRLSKLIVNVNINLDSGSTYRAVVVGVEPNVDTLGMVDVLAVS